MIYVILTSKPGQFSTRLPEEMTLVEQYDYLFCGLKKAHFVIAAYEPSPVKTIRVRVTEDHAPHIVNEVPSKFLPHFATLAQARAELKQLSHFGTLETELKRLA